MADASNGWEAVAHQLIAVRSQTIGVATLQEWARSLPAGSAILDIGCGSGVPVSETLIAQGFTVSGLDASPTLVAAFGERFPHARVICEAAEKSPMFGDHFDAIVAIGLMFLLRPKAQKTLIRRVGRALKPRGRFLFTAPIERYPPWRDDMTGYECFALGEEAYRAVLATAGMSVIGEYMDEGENHYFDAMFSPHDL